jgi:hypothetical protein
LLDVGFDGALELAKLDELLVATELLLELGDVVAGLVLPLPPPPPQAVRIIPKAIAIAS